MLNKTDKKAIEKTVNIIQKEIEKRFEYHKGFRTSPKFHALEHTCHQIKLLIECRNRLKNYFINGLD